MLLFIVFAFALALPAVWLFARTKPSTSRVDVLSRFNAITWSLAGFAGLALWIYFSGTFGQASDGNWSPPFAIIASVASGSAVLLIGALVRLLVFRRLR